LFLTKYFLEGNKFCNGRVASSGSVAKELAGSLFRFLDLISYYLFI
jgi:hypothetical protein